MPYVDEAGRLAYIARQRYAEQRRNYYNHVTGEAEFYVDWAD